MRPKYDVSNSEGLRPTTDRAYRKIGGQVNAVVAEHLDNNHPSMGQYLDSKGQCHEDAANSHQEVDNIRGVNSQADNHLEKYFPYPVAPYPVAPSGSAYYRSFHPPSANHSLQREPAVDDEGWDWAKIHLAKKDLYPKTVCSGPIDRKALHRVGKEIAKLHTAEPGCPIAQQCACCPPTNRPEWNCETAENHFAENRIAPERPVPSSRRIDALAVPQDHG